MRFNQILILSLLIVFLSLSYFISAQSNSWHSISNGVGEGLVEGHAILEHQGFIYLGGRRMNPNGDIPGGDDDYQFLVTDGNTIEPASAIQLEGNNLIRTMANYQGGILVGGDFDEINDDPNMSNIAFWNGHQWESLGTGVNGEVRTIYVEGNDVYVGGEFSNAGGVLLTFYIARWDGQEWHNMDIGLGNDVRSIIRWNGDIYAAGDFVTGTARYLAKWNGSSWESICNNFSSNGSINDLEIFGGDLVLAGRFTTRCIDGEFNSHNVLGFDGTNFYQIGSSLTDNGVNDVEVFENKLYATGSFQDAGGDFRADELARFNGISWENVIVTPSNSGYVLRSTSIGLIFGGDYENLGGGELYDIFTRFGPQLNSACQLPINNFLENQILNGTYEAQNHITITGETNVEGQAYVKAGKSIYLGPGFHAEPGNSFTASIESCQPVPKAAKLSAQIANPKRVDNANNIDFEIYPNPVNDLLTINSPSSAGFEVELRSTDGRLLSRRVANGQSMELNTNNLSAGTYVLLIQSAEGRFTQLVVK